MTTPGKNGWGEWANYVLKELERQEEEDKSMKHCLTELKIKVAEHGVRTSVLAALGASIPALISILVQIYLYSIK